MPKNRNSWRDFAVSGCFNNAVKRAQTPGSRRGAKVGAEDGSRRKFMEQAMTFAAGQPYITVFNEVASI